MALLNHSRSSRERGEGRHGPFWLAKLMLFCFVLVRHRSSRGGDLHTVAVWPPTRRLVGMPRAAEKALVGVGADFRRTPTGEHWVDDSTRTSCIACSKTFTLLRRRHHCRQCGEVFCGSCAPERQPAGLDTPMRLCKACARLPRSAPPAFAGFFRQISSVFCCAE